MKRATTSSTLGTATGSAVNNKAATAAPITGATALSGAASTNSLSTNFAAGDTITVNGTPITFVASGATGNELNVTDSVQTLLSKIDSITGTSTPSTVSGGVITLHTDNAASLNITSSNKAAFAALGFGPTVTAVQPPLRVSGSPLSSATSLVNGSADTVAWYTGNSSASPRASSTARVDSDITVQYGAQANEQAIRNQLEGVAVFAADHGVAHRDQFGRADLRAQLAHRDQPDGAAGPTDHLGYSNRFCQRPDRDAGGGCAANPDPDHAAEHRRPDRNRIHATGGERASGAADEPCRPPIKPLRCFPV